LLGGWQFSNIVNLQTGAPVDYYDAYNDFSYSADYNDRWNIYGDPGSFKWSFNGLPYYPAYMDNSGNPVGDPRCLAIASAQGSIDTLTSDYGGCYISKTGTVLIPPALGQFGTLRRNSMRGPAFTNWDISLAKTLKLTERFNLQVRGDVFNILNHPNFSLGSASRDLSNGPLGSVGIPIYTPDVYESNPVMGSGGSRHIQLGAKIIF
jgi:hypothetical protein